MLKEICLKIFVSILLVLCSFPAFAQSRKALQPRLSVVSRDFTITNFGAVGDAQALTNCSIASGADRVICGTGKFVAADVGKVFALYGAGTLRGIYQQPLYGSIVAVISAYEVQVSASASITVTNSERFVWGTNNTTAIQSAVDAAADAGGGEVEIPAGHYLTERVVLDCAAIGNFPGYGYSQPCVRSYANITLRGNAALTTTLENWNPDLLLYNGLIDLGRAGEIPQSELPGASPFWPPHRLKRIEIAGLTLRQVKFPTRPIKIIYAYATEDVSVHDCYLFGYSYEGVYMGGGFKSVRWRVFNNVASEIGKGGPAYGNTTSAYNLNGSYVEAFNNKATNSGQCFEAGSRHGFFFNNLCESATIAFHFGSTGSGVWDNTVTGNTIKNCYYALIAGNGGGTFHSLRFSGNTMIDSPDINITGGRNQNTVNESEFDTVVHSQSVVTDNTFVMTNPAHANRTIFRFFLNPNLADYGAEQLTVADNTVTYSYLPTAPFLNVGGQGGYKWEPNRAFALNAPGVPSMWSAYWYKATTAGTSGATEPAWPQSIGSTVQDGGITWLCMGARPQVFFHDNRAILPPNIPDTGSLYGTWPGAIRLDYGVREMVKVNNLKISNVRWRVQVVSPDMHEEIILADAPYSDSRRFAKAYTDDEPTASFWQVGWYVQKKTISDVYGWTVIRAGYAAPAYSAAASYSTFGTFVKPATDNGKIYQLIGGTCAATPEPVWPTAIGATVTNGGCTWKAAANAAKFTPLR